MFPNLSDQITGEDFEVMAKVESPAEDEDSPADPSLIEPKQKHLRIENSSTEQDLVRADDDVKHACLAGYIDDHLVGYRFHRFSHYPLFDLSKSTYKIKGYSEEEARLVRMRASNRIIYFLAGAKKEEVAVNARRMNEVKFERWQSYRAYLLNLWKITIPVDLMVFWRGTVPVAMVNKNLRTGKAQGEFSYFFPRGHAVELADRDDAFTMLRDKIANRHNS